MNSPVNSFNQIRANAEVGGNSIYGRTFLPQNDGIGGGDARRSLYDKLKNNITYSTTGFAREERNIGSMNLERW